MTQYIVRRLLITIPILLTITILVFLMMHMVPGDPVLMMLAEAAIFDPAQIEQLRETLGFNDPLPVQYFNWIKGVVTGDLGYSFIRYQPVLDLIKVNLPHTLSLTTVGILISVTIGLVLGTLAAVKHNTWVDSLAMFTALVGVSMPSFWLGLMMIFLFSLRLGWLPATGTGGWERMVMPALTLGVVAAGTITRMVRSSVLDVMRSDYVRTARAKGVMEHVIVMSHVLRNALVPVITIVGIQFGRLLAGTVVIESVFSRPGLGRLTVSAILAKDFQVVQAGVMISAVIFMVVNLIVDICYALIDPRITY